MNRENETLYIDEKIDFEDCEKLLQFSHDVEKIIVRTNDIHPAAFQILFCVSQKKEIHIEDGFNRRFFENLEFQIND